MKIAVILALTFVAMCQGKSVVSFSHERELNYKDESKYEHCGHVRDAGYSTNGTYRLHVGGKPMPTQCSFDKSNAYTLILKRSYPSVSFQQTWAAYEGGFGDPNSNYWAGLANIYAWTAGRGVQLLINMQDWSSVNQNVKYNYFALGPRDQRYRLAVSGYQGSVGDMLSYHNNMPFSTYDAPDPYQCASGMKAGWWYNYCAYALPTGIIYQGGYYTPSGDKYDGMFWQSWHNYNYALRFLQMQIIH